MLCVWKKIIMRRGKKKQREGEGTQEGQAGGQTQAGGQRKKPGK
jgi:hypothetical protein